MMHDSRRTAPTFLIYAGGWVFLGGLGWAWFIGVASSPLLELAGHPAAVSLVAGASTLVTMGLQWLLIWSWRHWNTPKTPSAEHDPIQLSPDTRQRIQTGQGT